MALYRLACENPACRQHLVVGRKVLRPSELEDWLEHNPCECGRTLARQTGGPGVDMVERLDNGFMPKAVVRPVAIKEMVREHNRKAEGK